ncbi:DinB family protein [Paenibacillus sp. JX-17]|uniref:DinB family protein n=1 Tax=Paenibacillus lacisoli TaxID=3064525 RepID=A0ABT9CEG7_9BACL|nr:DinB family protein [Paenibacillus sp. JX-17]MDO7907670.1 DinB family protein [Paenibacillus sp. JX-17]
MSEETIPLYEYHAWANKIVFSHLHILPEDIWNQNLTSVFPSIHQLLSHMLASDVLWLSVMCERPFEEARAARNRLIEETGTETLTGMRTRFDETVDQYRTFLNQSNPALIIPLAHPHYGTFNSTLSAVVQHVVNHGTYHRGNLTAMLHQLGHQGVPTDYVFYLYQA